MTARYSFAPVDRMYPPDPNRANRSMLYDVLGVSRRTIYRYRNDGLDSIHADHVAIRLGLHPVSLWPSWFDDAAMECCPWCGIAIPITRTVCSYRCSRSLRVEREDINALAVIAQRKAAWWRRLDRYRENAQVTGIAGGSSARTCTAVFHTPAMREEAVA